MKRSTFKAFTLVEMLIVIVIIGILIAALLPRLQGAQSMARDTSRKTALSQLQSAIVAYQSLNGRWPEALSGNTNDLKELVNGGLMSSLPRDPISDRAFSGVGAMDITEGGYSWMVLTRNSVQKAGIILMAKTETPGNSNRVINDEAGASTTLANGFITGGTDLIKVAPCRMVTQSSNDGFQGSDEDEDFKCNATNLNQLYYIITY